MKAFSNRKESAISEKFFPTEVDPHSEGAWCTGKQTEAL